MGEKYGGMLWFQLASEPVAEGGVDCLTSAIETETERIDLQRQREGAELVCVCCD